MGTFTTNGYVYKPDVGETGFASNYNTGANAADAQIKANKDHKTAQDAISGLLKCNGSGTYTAAAQPYLVRGSTATQTPSTSSYSDVVGSSVSYTPKSGSSKVLYAFTCQVAKGASTAGYLWFRLVNNGIEVSNARRSMTVPTGYDEVFTYFHVMDSWTGAHTLKLQVLSLAGYVAVLNQTQWMDGGAGTVQVYNNVVVLEF